MAIDHARPNMPGVERLGRALSVEGCGRDGAAPSSSSSPFKGRVRGGAAAGEEMIEVEECCAEPDVAGRWVRSERAWSIDRSSALRNGRILSAADVLFCCIVSTSIHPTVGYRPFDQTNWGCALTLATVTTVPAEQSTRITLRLGGLGRSDMLATSDSDRRERDHGKR